MPIEIARISHEQAVPFVRSTEREALKQAYHFTVVWHEETQYFAAMDGEEIVGLAAVRIAASLAHIDRVVVAPPHRRSGIGRELLERADEAGKYYNCHKMTTLVPWRSGAQTFFERCGYREEAVLAQHTFKLDMAMMRRFLL